MKHKQLIITIIFLLLFSCSNNTRTKKSEIPAPKSTFSPHDWTEQSSEYTYKIYEDGINGYGPNIGRPTKFDTIFDARDSNYYETVLIGNTWWMTEDLRYIPPNNTDSTTIIQGRDKYNNVYYSHSQRKYSPYRARAIAVANINTDSLEKLCPEGWTIPTEEDWIELLDFYKINYVVSNNRTLEPHVSFSLQEYTPLAKVGTIIIPKQSKNLYHINKRTLYGRF